MIQQVRLDHSEHDSQGFLFEITGRQYAALIGSQSIMQVPDLIVVILMAVNLSTLLA